MSEENNLSPEDQRRLETFKKMLADVESGRVQGIPSNEDAIYKLKEDIAALEGGTYDTVLSGEPGALTLGQPFTSGPVPPGTIGLYPDAIPMLFLMGLDSPSQGDLDAFHCSEMETGWIEFALVPIGKLLVTMVRWPVKTQTAKVSWGLWMDTPWAHTPESWFDLRPLETSELVDGEMVPGDPRHTRYGVSCCLVDSDTNLVAGLRFFTLSPHYSRAYHVELERRLSEPPITKEEYMQLCFQYQARYPNPKMMLDRAIARCKAGLLGK